MAGQVHGRCPKVGVARWGKLRRVADAQGVLPGLGDRCDNRSAKTVERNLGAPPRKNRSRADPPIPGGGHDENPCGAAQKSVLTPPAQADGAVRDAPWACVGATRRSKRGMTEALPAS